MKLTSTQLKALRQSEPVHGNRLARACKLAKITMTGLAQHLGITVSSVSDTVHARYGITLTRAQRYASLFGVGVEDLWPNGKGTIKAR